LEITNFDELFDDLIKNEVVNNIILDDHIPYWTELWPSAKGLAQFLFENKSNLSNKTILELGSGLGLPSLVSAISGAKKVTATDLIDDAIYHVTLNALANEINNNIIDTKVLDWTKVSPEDLIAYDLIIAADIVYEKRFVHHFIDLVQKLIQNKKETTVILAEPGRDVAADILNTIAKIPCVTLTTTQLDVDSKGTIFGINITEMLFKF
jgi:predicted nicotinamide N-methyase